MKYSHVFTSRLDFVWMKLASSSPNSHSVILLMMLITHRLLLLHWITPSSNFRSAHWYFVTLLKLNGYPQPQSEFKSLALIYRWGLFLKWLRTFKDQFCPCCKGGLCLVNNKNKDGINITAMRREKKKIVLHDQISTWTDNGPQCQVRKSRRKTKISVQQDFMSGLKFSKYWQPRGIS